MLHKACFLVDFNALHMDQRCRGANEVVQDTNHCDPAIGDAVVDRVVAITQDENLAHIVLLRHVIDHLRVSFLSFQYVAYRYQLIP